MKNSDTFLPLQSRSTLRIALVVASAAFFIGCGGGGGDPAPVAGGGGTSGGGSGSGGGDPASGGSSPGPRVYGEPNNSQIRPGVNVSSSNGSCTSNFLYYVDANNYYLGAAAHCFSPDTNNNNGIGPCEGRNAEIGSSVTIQNAQFPGTLAYSSWSYMQDRAETPGSAVCTYNDFALIRIDERDLGNVHPAAFVFGGPTGLQSGTAAVGTPVVSYGRSSLNGGVATLQEKEGEIRSIQGGGWNYTVQTDNPGVSGDSGSAVLHGSNGRALGVLVTVGASIGIGLGSPVQNGVVNLGMALNYSSSFVPNLKLETWSTFNN